MSKIAANWVLNNLLGALKKAKLTLAESPVSAEDLGTLVYLIESGRISNHEARQIFAKMFATKETIYEVLKTWQNRT